MCSRRVDRRPTGRTGRRRWRPTAWSLRGRLVATYTGLLVALCAGIGAGTVLATNHFLTGQLDDQLRETLGRSITFANLGPPPIIRYPGPGPMFLDAPGQSVGTIGVVVTDGRVGDAAVVVSSGARQALAPAAAGQFADVSLNQPKSIHLDGLGNYRVLAGLADEGNVLVTGLPLSGVHDTLLSVIAIFGVLGAVGVALAVVAGIVIVGRQLRPLSAMAATADEVVRLDLERGAVSLPSPVVPITPGAERTEVGRLGGALTKMVDRISDALAARHASETRVRQFVADASHELRTPLTSIRGYTELAQRLSVGAHADLPYVLGRVESEAKRMSALVEDMLLLARLDEGRALDRDPVDLSELVIAAVSDAHVAGPDHRWPLDLPDDPVTVIGDRPRLYQVVANLLSNARVHTPQGTVVTTRLQDGTGGAVITVTDTGPGIPLERKEEIFHRFVRGDSSRSRRAGSTGLGLAITAAIVGAHGGRISVQSEPGHTTFTVELPRDADFPQASSGMPCDRARPAGLASVAP